MASNEEQTCTRPEDLEVTQTAQILETHGITTLVHEMKVDGHHLVERKQKTNVDPKASDDTPKMTTIIHSRSIDDRCYDVQETLAEGMDEPERVIKTEMTQEEVERFEEDWSNLWNPWDREQESSLKLASYLAKKWNDSSSILKIVK